MAKTCPGAGGGLDGGLMADCGCRSGVTCADVLPCAERSLSRVDTLLYELWLRSRSLGSRFIDAIVAPQGPSGAHAKTCKRWVVEHLGAGAQRAAAPKERNSCEKSSELRPVTVKRNS